MQALEPGADRTSGGGPCLIAAVGVLLLCLWAWYVWAFDYATALTGPVDGVLLVLRLLETLVVVGIAGSLVLAGYWFATRDFTAHQQWWGALWTLIGGLGIAGVVLLMLAHQLVEGVAISRRVFLEELILASAGGALAGLLIGIGTAESLRQTETIAEQRDVFAALNALLRHNILNSVQVIQGRALSGARGDVEGLPANLRSIVQRCRSIASLTENVREVAAVASGSGGYERVNLSAMVLDAAEDVADSFEDAIVDVEVPPDLTVEANPALRTVFEALVANAVEHNDSARPRVRVRVEDGPDATRVEIADNGPGVDQPDSLLEPGARGGRGLGLSLVRTVLSHHGGRLEVGANEPRGTIVRITLPKQPRPRR